MNRDIALNLEQGRGFDEGFGLRVDGISSVRVCNRGDRLQLLLFLALLFGIVELDIAFESGGSRSVIGRLLLELFLLLGVFLLIRWRNDAPASSPWYSCAKPDSDPLANLETSSLHDDVDIIERLAFAGNEGAGVGFLESSVFIHGETDACSPLYKRVVGVEVKEVSVSASGGNTQDILQRLLILGSRRQ